MSILSEIKLKYQLADISIKLIFINVGIFAIVAIYNAIFYSISTNHASFFVDYFSLPNSLNDLVFRPWSIFSYGFLHLDFFHLLGNIIVLYFTGSIFLNFFSSKQFISYYIFGIIAGGFTFLLSYNLLPAFKNETTVLVGASAAIFSTLVGVTAYVPNYEVHLFGVFKLKLWVITILLIIGFIAGIPGANSGGEFAHLGGAFIGYFYTMQLKKGNDLGTMFSNLFKTKKTPLKTVYKKSKPSTSIKNSNSHQRKIDDILDKISKSGYETLTKEEKEFLFSMGKK